MAELLGVSSQRVIALAQIGLPHDRAGREYRFNEAEARAWVDANTMRQHADPRRRGGRKIVRATPITAAAVDPDLLEEQDDPTLDATIGAASAAIRRLMQIMPKDMTRVGAATLKDVLSAAQTDLDLQKRRGELVEVADLRVTLSRAFTSAERYLDTSRRPVALSIAESLGLPHDQVGVIEEKIAARDEEFRRRMRRGVEVEETEA